MKTRQNIIKLLIGTVLLLVLTACDSKTTTNTQNLPSLEETATGTKAGTDDNTITDGSNDNNATTETNTATVDTDGNTTKTNTTVPMEKIKSLELTVGKTSLNREENTTVKVMAVYGDGTRKEVTNEVNWIQKPKDTLLITNAVLSSFKDVDTEIRAILPKQHKASNAVTLDLYWEVRGHRLPPEPDSIQNNTTLEGIDSNDNGVRDDVERKIYEKYPKALHVALLMDGAKQFQKVLVQPLSNAKILVKDLGKIIDCKIYLGRSDMVIGSDNFIMSDILENSTFNNPQRVRKYLDYNLALSGGTYGGSISNIKRDICSSEVIKVLEKLGL